MVMNDNDGFWKTQVCCVSFVRIVGDFVENSNSGGTQRTFMESTSVSVRNATSILSELTTTKIVLNNSTGNSRAEFSLLVNDGRMALHNSAGSSQVVAYAGGGAGFETDAGYIIVNSNAQTGFVETTVTTAGDGTIVLGDRSGTDQVLITANADNNGGDQVELRNTSGTKRMSFGVANAGTDVALGMLPSSSARNITLTTLASQAGPAMLIANLKVVGVRGAAVTKPTGGGTVDAEARTAIDLIIDRLGITSGHGLIA